MKAHFFNIDNLLININQKVWIIEKNNPSVCIMKLNKEDFDLIKAGVFKAENIKMDFSGRKYWLSKIIFDKIQKSIKNITSEELTFSFREFTEPKSIEGIEISYDLSPIIHLKNTNDDVFFISTKGAEDKYGNYYTQLIYKLKEEGLIVKQIYYLNQSFFAQNKDANIKKICYVLLSNMLGKNIENDKLGDDLDRKYDEVHYYDNSNVTINKIDSQILMFLDFIHDEKEKLKNKLFLHLVGSNSLKPFSTMEVALSTFVKKFEHWTYVNGSED